MRTTRHTVKAATRGVPLLAALVLALQVGCGSSDSQERTGEKTDPGKEAARLASKHFQRGRDFSKRQRFDKAEAAYRRALQLDSSFAAAWINLGNDAARQKQRRRAIRFYAKARKAYPAKASVLIGRAYAALREADSARQAYEEALAADSAYAPAHLWLGQLLEDQGRLKEALRHTRRAHKLKPQSADYRYLLGAQLVQAGRVEEAIGHLERVAKRKPWHYGAEYNLGQALLQQGGRAKEAERHLARADSLRRLQNDIGQLRSMIHTQPKNPEYWKRLAAKLRQAGREEEAAQARRRARTLTQP